LGFRTLMQFVSFLDVIVLKIDVEGIRKLAE